MRLLRQLSNKFITTHQRLFSMTPKLDQKTNDVLIEIVKDKAIITLNRPKALNALSLPMIRDIYPNLIKWQKSDELKLIIIKGEGEKAFCAGGDIRSMAEPGCDPNLVKDFFREEYMLNHAISISKIPWIALIDGFTFGGGVGLSVHGPYRVATERSVFAMPETAIGLFPDVGGGYFLPRMSNSLGTFLGLSGYRLKGKELLHANIATHFVDSAQLDKLEKDLLAVSSSNEISSVLQTHQNKATHSMDFSLEDKRNIIGEIFSSYDFEEILKRLEDHQGSHKEWCQKQLKNLLKMCPSSVKITLRQLQKGAHMNSLKEVLEMEYQVTQRVVQRKDFFEGVRALLIDRDNNPKWDPASHTEVTKELVESHFDHLPQDQKLVINHDL